MSPSRRVGVSCVALLLSAWLVGGLSSCSKSEEKAEPAAATPPSDEQQKSEADESESPSSATAEASSEATASPKEGPGKAGGETPLDSVALPSAKDCVRTCVDRNQMRAVSPEQITADCTRTCRKSCLERCDAAAVGRSPHFGEECRKDCDRQLGKDGL